MASISELEKWVHEQKLQRWTREHFREQGGTLNHIFINPPRWEQPNVREQMQIPQRRPRNFNPLGANWRNLFEDRRARRPAETTFTARGRIPSIFKRVFAEVIDSFILVGIRVLILLSYYAPSWGEIFNPSVEVLDNIISDLSASIILQSSLLDEALLDDIDMTEEFVSSWLSSLSFRLCAMCYETFFVATCQGTIGKRLMGMKIYSPTTVEWVEGSRHVQLNNCVKTRWKGAFLRASLKNISSLLMIPGHMTPLFNRMRRAIYDSVAGTIVVEKVHVQT